MWRYISNRIVQHAKIYNRIQRTVGSARIWMSLHEELYFEIQQMSQEDIWLDLGCGTAEFLAYLPPDMNYVGVDNNSKYIHHAQKRYAQRPNTTFICGDWHDAAKQLNVSAPIKIISLLGLLHHLNDAQAKDVLTLSYNLLSDDGLIFSLDGCPCEESSLFERFFYWIDRGDFIRTESSMRSLFPREIDTAIHSNWLLVPYKYVLCRMNKQ